MVFLSKLAFEDRFEDAFDRFWTRGVAGSAPLSFSSPMRSDMRALRAGLWARLAPAPWPDSGGGLKAVGSGLSRSDAVEPAEERLRARRGDGRPLLRDLRPERAHVEARLRDLARVPDEPALKSL